MIKLARASLILYVFLGSLAGFAFGVLVTLQPINP